MLRAWLQQSLDGELQCIESSQLDDELPCIESSQLMGLGRTTMYRILATTAFGWRTTMYRIIAVGRTCWVSTLLRLPVNCLATTALDTELHVSNRRN